MTNPRKLQVRFWGVRGSIPTPVADNLGYGGNTACVEVRYEAEPPLIFDAGTGARRLCTALLKEAGGSPFSANIFLTHFHWDHIQGIPFMPALHAASSQLTFYSDRPADMLQDTLKGQMSSPYFPVHLPEVLAEVRHHQIEPQGLEIGSLTVKPFPLCHPDGAVGYRISAPGECVVYASDHEHGDDQYDRGVLENAQGADMLIYDAQFTPEEYPSRVGWGHSTWLEGTKVARQAGVNQLALFHHDPGHDDQALSAIERDARGEFANTVVTKEGQ